MIKVSRARSVPAGLTSEKAEKERSDAAEHYENDDNWRTEFTFKAYGDRSVRDALEQIFRDKCAYCETKIGVGDESEIEHWRPKGAVKERTGERSYPGYYWLASEWGNLLLACIKCNRPRKYRLQSDEEDEERWQRSGKGMLFPLADGDARAKRKGDEKHEHALLLNPCRDKPEHYLEVVVFDDNPTREGAMRPRGVRGRRRRMGEESIDVYSLNRTPLVDARRKALKDLQRRLGELRQAQDVLDQLPPGAVRETQAQLIGSQLEGIRAMFTPDSEYLLMARQTLAAFLSQEPRLRQRLSEIVRR